MLILIAIYTFYILVYNLAMFIPAKVFGVEVEKFYIWYDWKFSLFKFKQGKTVFGLGWLPLGGYVKLAGMIEEEGKELKVTDFRAKSIGQRMLILCTGPISSLLVGLGIYGWISGTLLSLMVWTVSLLLFIGLSVYIFMKISAAERGEFDPDDKRLVGLDYLLSFLFYGVILAAFTTYIYYTSPFFHQVMYVFSEEIVFEFNQLTWENWIVIAAFTGVFNFCTNILPMGGLIGGMLLNQLYVIRTGKSLPDTLTGVISLLASLIVFFVFTYFIYKLLF